MRVVFFNVLSFAEAAGVVKVLQRGKRAANDPLCCVNDPLYPPLYSLSASVQLQYHTVIQYVSGSPLQSDRRSPAA